MLTNLRKKLGHYVLEILPNVMAFLAARIKSGFPWVWEMGNLEIFLKETKTKTKFENFAERLRKQFVQKICYMIISIRWRSMIIAPPAPPPATPPPLLRSFLTVAKLCVQ